MTTEFNDLNLRPELAQTVADLGYTTPTPIQAALIPVMLTCQDVIGQSQTGTGKTAAFAIPIIQHLSNDSSRNPQRPHIKTLVVTPTRELAIQIDENIRDSFN